jgi:predicted TPR repeat methyltransferase
MREKSEWITKFYDPIAREYDGFRQKCGADSGIIFKMTESYLPRVYKKRILDIGCGTGLSAAPFAEKGLRVFGIDASEEMLKVFSEKRFAQSLQMVDAEKDKFPFKKGYFGLVISNRTFCYLSSLDNAIGEAGRVLKGGGIFCFTVGDIGNTEPFKDRNIYRYKLEYLTETLQKAGFDSPVCSNYTDYRILADPSPAIFTVLLCRKK